MIAERLSISRSLRISENRDSDDVAISDLIKN